MKITKRAQSCLLVEAGESKILIDPGIFVFNEEGIASEDFRDIDVIVFTHEHRDHFDIENVKKILDLSRPVIIGTQVVADLLKDFSEVLVSSAGFEYKLSGCTIQGYMSKHGPLPIGGDPPEVCGIVIDDGVHRLYMPGDTLYLDQSTKADIVAVPICGKVTMNIEEAKSELLKLKPKLVIPIHCDSPMFPVEVSDFEKAMEKSGISIKILKWGETIDSDKLNQNNEG
jgi:L-ascorbate metabolism protein UlaG (beta-lactamase superfamily)